MQASVQETNACHLMLICLNVAKREIFPLEWKDKSRAIHRHTPNMTESNLQTSPRYRFYLFALR